MRATTFQRVSLTPLVVVCLVLLVGVVFFSFMNRCTPTRFSRGDAIAIGAHRLTVSSVEAAAADGEDLELLVYHSWVRVAPDERRRGIKLRPRFSLVDSEGRSYRPSLRMDAERYRGWQEQNTERKPRGYFPSQDQTEGPEDWVASFTVPRQSKGFFLVVTNPERRENQPCSAVVPLGR